MDIFYRILWYEDQKDWYNSMKNSVEKAIKEFKLIPQIDFKKTPEINIKEIEEKNYDLILVDYNLSNKKSGINGDKVIENIRNGKIYTDVIFYSEDGEKLKDIFTKKELEGVFIARRNKQAFINKIRDITYKNLRRSLNPANLRGIIMDNTSEFDTEIKEITLKAWELLSDENKKEIDEYIKKGILEKSIEGTKRKYEDYINKTNMIINEIVEDMIFDSSKKVRLLNKIMTLDEEHCKELKRIFDKLAKTEKDFNKSYDDEIIKYRNALAHAKKTEAENDIYIGKHNGKNIVFNKELCDEVRENLIKYNAILDALYKYIEEE